MKDKKKLIDKVLAYFKENPFGTDSEVQKALNISQSSTVSVYVSRCVKDGRIIVSEVEGRRYIEVFDKPCNIHASNSTTFDVIESLCITLQMATRVEDKLKICRELRLWLRML